MSNMIKKVSLTITLVFLLTGVANAKLLEGVGQPIIMAPVSVVNDAVDGGYVNDRLEAFDEAQGVVISKDLKADNGVVLKTGTKVSSHMILMNADGPLLTSTQVFTFQDPILAVMSDESGTFEAASSYLLGYPGTIYPAAFKNRGLEHSGQYDYYVILNQYQILVFSRITQPGDWLRVVTGYGATQMAICHVPPGNPNQAKTLWLPFVAVAAHLNQHADDAPGVCSNAK